MIHTMYEYARNGTIRPCKVDGVKFNKRDVLALINEDIDSLSPYIYKQTQKENEKLKEENSRLRRVIMEISVTANTALLKGEVE